MPAKTITDLTSDVFKSAKSASRATAAISAHVLRAALRPLPELCERDLRDTARDLRAAADVLDRIRATAIGTTLHKGVTVRHRISGEIGVVQLVHAREGQPSGALVAWENGTTVDVAHYNLVRIVPPAATVSA